MLYYKTIKVIDQEVTGVNARIQREAQKLSQRKVAKHMGISTMYLSDLERNRRNWREKLMVLFDNAMKEL